jgi:saccharopine dehydrogenase-like NADP-dependent oxidoreductase
MSSFRRFAIVGAGKVGNFIIEELLKQKAAGAIDDITIISRLVRPLARSSLRPTISTLPSATKGYIYKY